MNTMISELSGGLKRLNSIKKDLSDLEFKEEILALKELLLAAKEQALSLEEENSNLTREIQSLRSEANRKAELVEVEGFKYDSKQGKPICLPYCPICEVSENGKMFRLNRSNDFYSDCPRCNTSYNVGKNGQVHVAVPMQPRRVTGIC